MESTVPQHIPGVSSSIMVQPLLDVRVPYRRLHHPFTIYPIDQMKVLHVENDYIETPAVISQQPQSHKAKPKNQEVQLGVPHQQNLSHCEGPDATTHPWISFSGRPSSISSSSSTSSDQRLLDHQARTPVVDSYNNGNSNSSTLGGKHPKTHSSKTQTEKKHGLLCEKCGKCRCTECTLPRTLPSCWVCNQEYLCSAQNLVDSVTCMCLVKGIFYHCTDKDEEGSCADKPCSCSYSNWCARWTFMAAISLVLPCLVCYLPATGCAKLSQKCYDGISRTGCRCKSTQACKAAKVKACPVGKQPT